MISATELEKALRLVAKGRANYEYFFSKIQTPDWLQPLADNGFFKEPPPVISDGSFIRYPDWPESRYLARVASLSPDAVVKIVLEIPETDNARVIEDIAEVALQVSPDLAVQFTKRFVTALHSQYNDFLGEKLGKVAMALLRTLHSKQGVQLFRALFSFTKFESQQTQSFGDDNVRTRIDQYEFELLLSAHRSEVVQLLGFDGFRLFADVLWEYLRLRHGEKGALVDFTYIDRPAIEDHAQNWRHGIIDPVVDAVRDSAAQLVLADPTCVSTVVDYLVKQPWPLFGRVAMQLLSTLPYVDVALPRIFLADRNYYNSSACRHEYASLATAHFARLPGQDQDLILGWIDDQDLARIRSFRTEDATDEEIQNSADNRRLERLVPIKDSLPAAWRDRYDSLVERLGVPAHPDFTSYHSRLSVGPTSPLRPGELETMEPAETAKFLREWVANGDTFSEPSAEGLGRVLSKVVATQLDTFSAAANLFERLDSGYVQSFLSGVEQGLKAGQALEWAPVLDLCEWTVGQASSGHDASGESNSLASWSVARRQIASLMETALNAEVGGVTIDTRDRVWRIIELLTNDSDPDPIYEERYGGSNMDPTTIAINTVRGGAMNATISYILWLLRNASPDGQKFSFAAAPEVREVLNRHLDPSIDPSLAIRSVYGRYSPWLAMADEQWFGESVDKIFPSDSDQIELWRAGWDAYIVFCQPYDQMLEMMAPVYAQAILDTQVRAVSGKRHDASKELAFHLLAFYGRGKLEIGDGGLFDLFLTQSPSEVRAKGLRSLGNNVRHNAELVDVGFVDRFQALWSQRLLLIESAPEQAKVELPEFGWWFASGVFDEVWSLETVWAILSATQKIEPIHMVMEKLASLAPRHLRQALAITRIIFASDMPYWERHRVSDHGKKILGLAIRSGSPELEKKATEFVHFLGAKGHFEFRSLLRESIVMISPE